jgi:Zn-dependent M16 (insulinase) family peptidase
VIQLVVLMLIGMGELIVNFLGPPPNAFLERKALDILGTYLTSSAVAPLNKEFVEIESPLWQVLMYIICQFFF